MAAARGHAYRGHAESADQGDDRRPERQRDRAEDLRRSGRRRSPTADARARTSERFGATRNNTRTASSATSAPRGNPGGVNAMCTTWWPRGTVTPITSPLVRRTGTGSPSTVACQPALPVLRHHEQRITLRVDDDAPGIEHVRRVDRPRSTRLVETRPWPASGVRHTQTHGGSRTGLASCDRICGSVERSTAPTRYASSRRGVRTQRVKRHARRPRRWAPTTHPSVCTELLNTSVLTRNTSDAQPGSQRSARAG